MRVRTWCTVGGAREKDEVGWHAHCLGGAIKATTNLFHENKHGRTMTAENATDNALLNMPRGPTSLDKKSEKIGKV